MKSFEEESKKDLEEMGYDNAWRALYSARYILEDANPEKLADACGLPLGVIVSALENILKAKGGD